jgi:DNA-binding beta-propeller fold protein YncE
VINKSIKIDKGEPTYAAINTNTNTAYISYEKSDFIIVINLEKGTIENKIQYYETQKACENERKMYQ